MSDASKLAEQSDQLLLVNLNTELQRWKKGVRAVRFYRHCVRPANLCFDIGANRGSRSVIFTLLGARTIAVEPNSSLTGFLKYFPRVTIEHVAVSDAPGRKVLLQNANDQISSLNPDWKSKWPQFSQWVEREVACTTLDELIGKYGLPDFCKIDVEGHEPAVLHGLSRAIPLLSFEAAPDFSENTARCVARLGTLGDYEFNFSAGDDFTWASPRWVKGNEAGSLVKAEAGDLYARLISANRS